MAVPIMDMLSQMGGCFVVFFPAVDTPYWIFKRVGWRNETHYLLTCIFKFTQSILENKIIFFLNGKKKRKNALSKQQIISFLKYTGVEWFGRINGKFFVLGCPQIWAVSLFKWNYKIQSQGDFITTPFGLHPAVCQVLHLNCENNFINLDDTSSMMRMY